MAVTITQEIFVYMADELGFKFPLDVRPGTFGNPDIVEFDEAAWNAYQWNPPPNFSDRDLNAAAKPTWNDLVEVREDALKQCRRTDNKKTIKYEETNRICAAYIGDQDIPQTVELEILYRLRAPAAELAPKDVERDRLHGKAVALKAWIEHADRTLAELKAFDPADDAHWAAPAD